MANLFAQASVNWDSANMWNDVANGSGNFVTPGASDVCMANNKTVTVNISPTVAEVRNDATGGATGGGKFLLNNSVTLTANVYAGVTAPSGSGCIQYNGVSPNSASIVGNITGGTGSGSYGAVNLQSGTLNITGNVNAGTGSDRYGVFNASTGTVNITGSVTGGSASSAICYCQNNTSSTCVVNGTISSGSGGGSAGASIFGTLTVTGDVIGANSAGITINGTSTITINGNVAAGSASTVAHGITMSSTIAAAVTVNGNVTGSSSVIAHGINSNTTSAIVINGNVIGGTGHGINKPVASTGALTINGDVIGGSTGFGVYAMVGTINVNGNAVSSNYVNAAPGIYHGGTTPALVDWVEQDSRYGRAPIAGNVVLRNGRTVDYYVPLQNGPVLKYSRLPFASRRFARI